MRGVGKDYRGVAALKDIDFDLRRGEILGFYGLVGAGRSEAMLALMGSVCG